MASAKPLSSRCARWAQFHARYTILKGEKYKDGTVYDQELPSWGHEIPRDCSILVRVVRSLKTLANGSGADLRIVEIPDDVKWEIQEVDGMERIREKSRSWG